MKNLGLKLFSLLFAGLLAYYVHSDTNEGVMGITVPVELKNLPANKVLVSPLAKQAAVSLKGPSFLLPQINAHPPPFQIRVPSEVGNTFKVTLNPTDLALPPSVRVVRIDPGEIEFTFDTLITRELPVQITQIGALREGLKLQEMNVKPNKVSVTGPQGELNLMSAIESEPIDLREINGDTERELILRTSGKLSDISHNIVKVKISTLSLQEERRFQNLDVEVRAVGVDMVSITPANVAIEISGPKEKILALKPEEILPYVRIQSENLTSGSAKVLVDLPKSISLVIIEPEQVKIVKSTGTGASTSKRILKGDTGKK